MGLLCGFAIGGSSNSWNFLRGEKKKPRKKEEKNNNKSERKTSEWKSIKTTFQSEYFKLNGWNKNTHKICGIKKTHTEQTDSKWRGVRQNSAPNKLKLV